MRDQCVQRVLIQLESVRFALQREELRMADELNALRRALEPLSALESFDGAMHEAQLLGRIDGLVTAQLVITERASKYRELSLRDAIRERHPAPIDPPIASSDQQVQQEIAGQGFYEPTN